MIILSKPLTVRVLLKQIEGWYPPSATLQHDRGSGCRLLY